MVPKRRGNSAFKSWATRYWKQGSFILYEYGIRSIMHKSIIIFTLSIFILSTFVSITSYGSNASKDKDSNIDYSGRSAHALKRVQRTGIAV